MSDLDLLNQTLGTVTAQITAFYPSILLYSVAILGAVALLQLGWIAVTAIASGGTHNVLYKMAMGTVRILFAYVVIDHTAEWGNALIQTGIQFGQNVTGQSPNVLTPSGIFDLGLNTAGVLLAAKSAGGWLHPVQDLEFFLTAFAVVVIWTVIALVYLGVLLEAAWCVYTGPLFISFSPFAATVGMLERWFGQILALALKLVMLILLLAIGEGIAQGWSAQIAAAAGAITTNTWYLILSLVQAVVFLFMVWFVPAKASAIVGASLLNLGESLASSIPSTAIGTVQAGASAAASGVSSGVSAFNEASHHKMIYNLAA